MDSLIRRPTMALRLQFIAFTLFLTAFLLIIPAARASSLSGSAPLSAQNRISAQNTATSQPVLATAAASQTPLVDLRGIYVIGGDEISHANSEKITALIDSFVVPGVDGFLLDLGWDAIEPGVGQYQWATLDKWMSAAVSASKKVDLAITAYNAPAWLFQPAPAGAGATPLHFSFIRKPSQPTCLSETIAAPWDTAYLAQWDSMLAAVSGHLKSVGTYGTLALLRLTGINKDTGELHLPSGSSITACDTDAVTTWQQAGYRPSLLLQGWDKITSSFKKYFPDKSFSVAIIASAPPFPTIAEDGSVIKRAAISNQNLPLLTLASQKFSGHLVIQNNSLYPDLPAQPETIQAAQTLRTMIAFQTNEDILGTGAACGGRTTDRATPCTAAAYLAELQTGIYPLGKNNPLRAQYIEVFAPDVNAFPDAILQAHQELIAQP